MRRMLNAVGTNNFRYGSVWNDEPSLEKRIQQIEGVVQSDAIPYTLQRVEFCRWPSWEQYRKSLSQNVLRNATKAEPNVILSTYNGPSALRFFFTFARLRYGVSRRKDIAGNRSLLGFLVRSVFLTKYITIKIAVIQGRVVAMNVLLGFGQHTYYIDAACVPDNGGAAWYLTLETLLATYNKHPHGTFAMGADEPMHKVRNGWTNLNRSRQSCRVSGVPSSMMNFAFQAGTAIQLSKSMAGPESLVRELAILQEPP
jgi:hypothetical protein